jgi:hypothetical protein
VEVYLMASGKTLTVYLAADVSKLRTGLNSADRSLSGFGNKLNGMIGPALIGATAAAGAFAIALGVDGVQAALADEAAITKLNKTLENLGFDTVSDEVQAFIDKTQMATGVADDQLRPSLNRLLLATNDVATAQNGLTLALDIAAGTGKSVEQVSNALGKAYEGNVGALAKLGVGMDSATLRSMTMEQVTTSLSSKFGGQAAAAAETYQGKIDRLNIAVDEAKETIGYALLNALDSVSNAFGGVGGLQDGIGQTGRGIAGLIGQVSGLIEKLGILANVTAESREQDEYSQDSYQKLVLLIPIVGTYLNALSNANENAARENANTAGTVENLTNKYYDLASAIQTAGTALSISDTFSAAQGGTPTGGYTPEYESNMNRLLIATNKAREALKEQSKATGGVAKAAIEMSPALRRQIDLVKELTGKVGDAGEALKTARQEMNNWISSMASSITSGINLGAAYDAMFNSTGEKTGQSLLEGFNKQIEQAGLFGNYLKQLNSEGGPELRDAVAALGPEAGNKLAKEIIDQGLIPTMQSKLVDVQHMAETTAAEMVPPMLVAGVQSAAGYLMMMQAELDESSALLAEMGRKMGATLTEAMVKEIRDALAAAGFAQAGASGIMAGTAASSNPAMAQAQAIAGNPLMNGTAIMQAIQRAIADSDQRLGRTGQVVLQ